MGDAVTRKGFTPSIPSEEFMTHRVERIEGDVAELKGQLAGLSEDLGKLVRKIAALERKLKSKK